MNTPQPFSLYLRDDGTLLIVQGPSAIEIRLTAAQLLQFGIDALQIAVAQQPEHMAAAADTLASVIVPAHMQADAARAIAEPKLTPGVVPCLLN